MEISIILWIVFALITAFIAAKKNRSFLGWLIIGLVVPIIGFILVLVLPRGEMEKPKRAKEATA